MAIHFDLHMHTTRHSPDSVLDPTVLVRRAEELGLDGLVITEHDWLWSEEELEELRAEAPGLQIYSGIEVSAQEGHFLAHGVTDPSRVPRGISVLELCREVHRQGGIVIAAHPFRWGQPFDEIVAQLGPALDGLELMSKNMDPFCRARAAEIAAAYQLPGLGSSDSHEEETLGVCYTRFETPIRDYRGLIAALRNGSGTPCERSG